jgi:hypothetical protein
VEDRRRKPHDLLVMTFDIAGFTDEAPAWSGK